MIDLPVAIDRATIAPFVKHLGLQFKSWFHPFAQIDAVVMDLLDSRYFDAFVACFGTWRDLQFTRDPYLALATAAKMDLPTLPVHPFVEP